MVGSARFSLRVTEYGGGGGGGVEAGLLAGKKGGGVLRLLGVSRLI